MDSKHSGTLPNVKKRLHMATPRLPLQETSGNIPSPVLKKTKLNNARPIPVQIDNDVNDNTPQHNTSTASATTPALAPQSTSASTSVLATKLNFTNKTTLINQQRTQKQQIKTVQSTSQSKNVGRLAGEELYTWQQSWRKIMKDSIVYFEGITDHDLSQIAEYKRASKYLKQVGCTISPFYDNDVTIIISRRPYSASKTYPSNDIFSNVADLKIKVWDYDKVFRFLKNLGVNMSASDENSTITSKNTTNPTSITNSANDGKLKPKDNLFNLLKEEKIYGSNDRDPNAKRDDLHYFDKNYLYVYDLSQKVRPIAIREWHEENYPVLNLTLDGKCPFIFDSVENSNNERKRLRRLQKFEVTRDYRALLKRATSEIISNIKNGLNISVSKFAGTSTSTDKIGEDEVTIIQNSTSSKKLTAEKDAGNDFEEDSYKEEQEDQIVEEETQVESAIQPDVSTDDLEQKEEIQKTEKDAEEEKNQEESKTVQPLRYSFKHPSIPTLARNSSCIPSASNSKFYDVIASGYNGASNALSVSMDATLNSNAAKGNGLGPMFSQVPSRNINNLNRRIFIKKKKQESTNSYNEKGMKEERELNPGYCENCRVKYDHFDDHIKSNRHRNFACDDRNFKDIDKLTKILNERRSSGYVTSNGDYLYAS